MPFSFYSVYNTQSLLIALVLNSLLFLVTTFPHYSSGIYDTTSEINSSEMQSGKRMSPFISYQPWSYMKRAPTAPIIRFGKRSNLEELIERSNENNNQQFYNKRSINSAPLIRFGRRISSAPLIRFGRSWKGNVGEIINE
ncbi:hypothetical protein Mgra_00002566 [Meloidogyne graminicola]|uniref:Uncharacterized protein n=2 Tax=Meloidogyne graminicola TaxID=189291 RepID=A0A8S9ZVX0_9BILA|nr:hypothetical protein Mgra_00002566 [Meloidogyne graminicola]